MKHDKERIAIIELHKNGLTNSEIVKATGYGRMKVHRAVKRFTETGGAMDRPRSGRPTTATTPENVQKVRCRIQRNPERSMRRMAKELGVDEKSIRHIVKRKLRLRSYKIARVHFLNDTMKAKRLEKSRRMLRLLAGARLSRVLFTDEKIFTVEPLHNRQNRRQLLRKGKNHRPQPFPGLHHGLGRDMRHREDASGFHPQKCKNQRYRVSTTGPPRRTGHLGNATLWPGRIRASAGLGAGAFGQIDNCRVRRSVSGLLEQRCLAAKLAGS
jgi:transposase